MRTIVPSDKFDTVYGAPAQIISREGETNDFTRPLVIEHTLTVSINERPSYEVTCCPTRLEDLVMGRLLTEGVIRSLSDVDLLYICQNGYQASVFLKETVPVNPEPAGPEKVPTCCTGNRTLTSIFESSNRPAVLTPIPFAREWIFTLASELMVDMPIYEETHGAHSALLMHQGRILTRAEDIGRHNALDKVIGWGLRNEVPLNACIVYTSGRTPVDMVLKVIRAGIPVLVSKGVPTQQSVALAREFHLTLISGARPDSMVVFTKA